MKKLPRHISISVLDPDFVVFDGFLIANSMQPIRIFEYEISSLAAALVVSSTDFRCKHAQLSLDIRALLHLDSARLDIVVEKRKL